MTECEAKEAAASLESGDTLQARDDRRKEPRYRPATEDANMGWWDGSNYETVSARLDDVSSGGASLILHGTTWQGGDVWVCLSGGVRSEWVRARVVGVSTMEDGEQRVRLAFSENCPFEFFKAAVWGQPANKAPARESPTGTEETAVHGLDEFGAARSDDGTPKPEGTSEVDPMRDLRISVTLFQADRAPNELGLKRPSEGDNHLVMVPSAYLSVVNLVVVLLIGCMILAKLASVWRIDLLLGTSPTGP